MDKLHLYRQPMVTATGIFLGFMLNFTSQWTRETLSIQSLRDVAIAISMVVSLILLLITLFRMLRMSIATDQQKFYRRTLLLFLIGIAIPFVAFVLIVADKFAISIGQH